MGGHNFFSNGIHLNCIENAPAVESFQNITAINDVVRDIFSMQNKITISAVQGNAGAGGVMMALASDLVLSRDGVVINPHYTNMNLFGSEYHTFFLERRVGREKAHEVLKHNFLDEDKNEMQAANIKSDNAQTVFKRLTKLNGFRNDLS